MLNFLKLIILSSLLWFLDVSFDKHLGNKIEHQVQVNHPGISLTESVTRTLFEIKNKQGHAQEFYMNVETVVCGDSQCRIDTVQIYWNALGFFDRLVLPKNVELEKAEGQHFDQADYKKLNAILADKNCSLKEVYKEEVVGAETTEGVDAYSGATIILNNKDYVKGAVWTCYTLWHWTNGDVFFIIRNISAGHLATNDLLIFLEKENPKHRIFALEQFTKQHIYIPKIIKAVQQNAPSNNYELTKLTIEYFENTSSDIYFNTMLEFLKEANSKQRLLYLNSILNNKNPAPDGFYKSLSLNIYAWDDYPSIDLFLKLLENKNISSSPILQSVLSLLKNENFVIARRAYWFLQKESLTPELQKKIQLFQDKNKERL